MVLESNYSNQVNAMSQDELAPGKVLNLEHTVEQGVLLLTWDAVTLNADETELTDLSGYRVYRKNALEDPYGEPIGLVDAATTSFEDKASSGLKDGATFVYAVTAIDGEATPNEGQMSDDLSANTIPSVPESLVSQSGNMTITLSWNAVLDDTDLKANENLAGYNIYRSEVDGEFTAEAFATVGPDITSYRDENVMNDVTYYYVVTAFDNSI